MPDGRAELELVIKVAQQQLKKLDKVRESITDLDDAAESLDNQDLDLDTAGLDKAQRELKETVRDTKALIKEGDRLEREFGSAVRALEKASKRIDFDPASRSTQRLRTEVDRAGRAMLEFGRRAPKALNATEKELRDVEKAAKRARGEFRKFQASAKPGGFSKLLSTFRSLKIAVGAFLGAIVIRKIAELGAAAVDAALDLGRLENALNAIEGVQADEVLERVRDRAKALGVDLSQLEKLTVSFVNTGKRIGLTLQESLSIIEGFSVASVGAGKSQEELARALRQVEQGLAKGKFEMQDLKIIMEVIPGVTAALSRGLGITTERLFELQKKGLIPAKEATIILAAELPKLFGEAVQANARDFRADVERISNELFEAGRTIGEKLIPELQALVKDFNLAGIEGKTAGEAIGDAFAGILRKFRNIPIGVKVISGAIKTQFLELSIFISEKVFGDLADEAIKKSKEAILEIEKDIKDTIADSISREEEAAKERESILKAEQEVRNDLAAKARADFEDNLKAREESENKSLKRRRDAFQAFLDATVGGTQTVGIQATGAAEASAELAKINSLLQTIGALEPKELTGITQEELDLLNAARRELQQINASGLGDIQGELSGVVDVTKAASVELNKLAANIVSGQTNFENLGPIAQTNIGLIITELQRLVERGNVTESEFTAIQDQIRESLGRTGEAGQTAAGQLLDYTNELQNSAAAARDVAKATGAAGQAIREVKNEAGDVVGFSNLEEGAKAAAGAIEILKGNEKDLADTISNTKDETIDAASAIKLLEDEAGKITVSNVGDQAKEAADGLGTLTGELKPAAGGLGETAGKAKELDTNLAAVSVTVEKLPAQISAALGVVTENSESLTIAQQVAKNLSVDIPLIGQGLTVVQTAIAPLAVDIPKLLLAINDAKEKGSFEAVKELAAQLAEKMPIAAKALKGAQEGLQGLLDAAASENAAKLTGLVGEFASDDNLKRLGQLKDLFADTAISITDTETNLNTLVAKAAEAASDSGAFADLEARLKSLIDLLNKRFESAIDKGVNLLDRILQKVKKITEKVEELSKVLETRLPEAAESGAIAADESLGRLERRLDRILSKLEKLKAARD